MGKKYSFFNPVSTEKRTITLEQTNNNSTIEKVHIVVHESTLKFSNRFLREKNNKKIKKIKKMLGLKKKGGKQTN